MNQAVGRFTVWGMVTMIALTFGIGNLKGDGVLPEEKTLSFDVRYFGAKGDAKADDTAAFQKAMDERARKGGGIVEVPAGKYLIKTHLVIPESVTLEGTWRAPASIGNVAEMKVGAPGEPLTGSILLAVDEAGKADGTPFITLKSNATLKGMVIFYPEQTKTNPPVSYPWTVATGPGGTENPSIIDVFMVNPYQAVDFGSFETMRPYICNLYADALYRGVYIDRCMDIARLENVHLAPFWHWTLESPLTKFVLENGEGFIFGRTDWQLVRDCFAAIYKVGFRFTKSSPSGVSRTTPSQDSKFTNLPTGNVMITGGGADMCDTAILVEDSQSHAGLSFANCQIFGSLVVRPTNSGPVRFTACGFFGRMPEGTGNAALAEIDAGRSRVSFSNCHFYALSAFPGKPLIHVSSGRINIGDSVFMNSERTFIDHPGSGRGPWAPDQVVLEPDVIAATIMGNEFYGPLRIVNKSKGKVAVANNIDQTDDVPSQ
ncbi:MAG: glycosyl hydrolase family 28-related protein [Opitutaceae bacterium]|nr:glycosyl hydrolase family 28-related protein [Opitutaceae bacterium]